MGGGITALALGAVLAKAGYSVTILESNTERLGGHARSVTIDGLEFCLGPQYLWNFGTSDIGVRLLRYVGIHDQIHFEPMDHDGFEQLLFEGAEPFAVPMGLDRFRDALCARFPQDRSHLQRFFQELGDLFTASRVLHDKGLYLRGGSAMRWGMLFEPTLSLGQKIRVFRLSSKSIGEMLNACSVSLRARQLLVAHDGIFAERASDLSAAVYASATGYYHRGASFPREGFRALIDILAGAVREHGGVVALGQHVTRLEHVRGRIGRVVCGDGTSYPADHVVSNLAPRATCALLDGCAPEAFRYSPSNSLLCCCVGMRPFPELRTRLARRNVWWRGRAAVDYKTPDMTAPPRMLYVGSPTANGYGNTPACPDGEALVVFAPGNYDQARDAHQNGEPQYEGLRRAIAERVVSTLDGKLFPGLASHVRFTRVFTPLEIARDTGAERGAVYGRRLTAREMLGPALKIGSIENLTIACATVGLPGISVGFQTAALVARGIAGIDV